MSRKKARECAFKCIYQIEFVKDYGPIDSSRILELCYLEDGVTQDQKEYIEEVFNGVIENLKQLDDVILSKLKNWNMNRISKIDIAILRLAIFEIKYISTIPVKVTANEAVELSKIYGNNESKPFVNGVIAKVIEDKEEN